MGWHDFMQWTFLCGLLWAIHTAFQKIDRVNEGFNDRLTRLESDRPAWEKTREE